MGDFYGFEAPRVRDDDGKVWRSVDETVVIGAFDLTNAQSHAILEKRLNLIELLPSGLGLKLDNVDVGRAGFVRCLPMPSGCVAEVVLDDKLLGQLKTAKTATFIIFETPEEGVGFPLSLGGFSEGYDKLP